MIEVGHYGIHWAEGGIAFLEQEKPSRAVGANRERSGTNALGLKVKSPFVVRPRRRHLTCNHLIPVATTNPDASHLDFLTHLLERDELTRVMLPIPKEGPGAYYLATPSNLAVQLSLLAQMSSPIRSPVGPVWAMVRDSQIVDELSLTNVQPLVLTGVAPEHTALISKLTAVVAHSPRVLLLVGAADVVVPAPFRRITTVIETYPLEELAAKPWQSLGAVVVRRFMRGEWTTPTGSRTHGRSADTLA